VRILRQQHLNERTECCIAAIRPYGQSATFNTPEGIATDGSWGATTVQSRLAIAEIGRALIKAIHEAKPQ
jgi:hypothetical protein